MKLLKVNRKPNATQQQPNAKDHLQRGRYTSMLQNTLYTNFHILFTSKHVSYEDIYEAPLGTSPKCWY